MTNTLNTPVEALERAFPMRVLRSSLRRGSGGAGQGSGGDGIERDLLMLDDVTVSLITERRSSPPWGLTDGEPGAVGENWLLPAGDEARAARLLDKCTVRLQAGDVLRMLTPGGGGWGAPAEIAVRPMTVDDVAAVQSVERRAGERFRSIADERIAACADHSPMPADALRRFVADDLAWVVTVDGAVVGFLVAEVLADGLHVEEVAVLPDQGDRGHATALLTAAAERASELGLSAVTLTTFRDVPWNRPFYERRGFAVLADDELTDQLRTRFAEEEEAHGLLRELRVVMRRQLAPESSVREATRGDLPAITQLFNALIPTTTVAWRDELADADEMAAWFDAQETADNPIIVAEASGEIVGYATWTWFRGGPRFPGYRHTRELTIHVDQRHHGRGVGRTLIEALVERARSSGVRVLVAAVDATNEASITFHRRLGFTEVARMPEVGRKFDRWLDLVLLQRIIDG